MSPRPYQLGQRQAAANETRARILAAARELLMSSAGFSGFSMEAVARQADVARMTVYHQFGSKAGLLEALMDDLAARGQMDRLAAAFHQPEPLEALDAFVAAFGRFWSTDRLAVRRLRGLAALDPEIEQALRARDEWRRRGLGVLLQRLAETYGGPSSEAIDEASDLLFTLTSFETFDTLAGPTRTPKAVIPPVQRLARAVLNPNSLPKREGSGEPTGDGGRSAPQPDG
jgi:AcrR family transcriptional regulator